MLLYGTVRSYGNIPGISHKIYLGPPTGVSDKIEVLRHHITTRNFFAFLQRKCLVGFTFYQALVDLHQRLEEYLPPGTDCTAAMRCYLVELGLVNVSNEPRAAAGLLAWSEDIRWNEGWREAFVHGVGMYEQLNQLQETADVSLPTKAHLDRKYLELQVRIQEVQDCLGKWHFDELHHALEDEPPSVKQASERFRKFLKQHYQKEYEHWPVKKGVEVKNLWLDRSIILRLQEDFEALYEFLVDRTVTWNEEKDEMSCESDKRNAKNSILKSNSQCWVDADDDRMLCICRNIDCRLNAADNIPYPYPILPSSVPPPADGGKKKGLFSKEKNKDRIRESRLAHAYNASTNADRLDREYAFNALVKAFITFEKSDQLDVVDPREARRERWTTIYCVLSTLANISVDVPNLSFKTNVGYFLNTRLNDLPPWCPDEYMFLEASREQSHCYTCPHRWKDDSFEQRNGDHASVSHRSLSSENSSNARPLSRHAEGSSYAFLSKPVESSAPVISFKHVGTKPSKFNHVDVKPKDFTRSNYSQSQASEPEEEFQLSPLTGASPFNNIFEPTLKPGSYQSDFGATDDLSDYSSAPPLTEASSSGPESSVDRNSSNCGSSHRSALPKKAAKLCGIEEYEARPLPLRPSTSEQLKGDKGGATRPW